MSAASVARWSSAPVTTACAWARAALNQALSQHCPSTWQQMLELAERELEQLTRTRSLRERIIHLLGPMLHGRRPELEEVASNCSCQAGRCSANWPRKARSSAPCSMKRGATWRWPISAIPNWRSAKSPTCSASPRPRPSSAPFKRWSGRTPGEFRRSQRLQPS